MKPIVLRPGEGEHIQLGQSSVVIKAGVETTEGRFALTETTLGPGFRGPKPHLHRDTLDMFFVLEGTLTMQLGEETLDLFGARSSSFPLEQRTPSRTSPTNR